MKHTRIPHDFKDQLRYRDWADFDAGVLRGVSMVLITLAILTALCV